MGDSTAMQCEAVTRTGKRCELAARTGSRWCWWHDPATAADRAAARHRGGKARHGRDLAGGEAYELRTVADVVALLGVAVGDLLTLENSVSRARAIASLATVAVRAIEVSEVEARLSALEARLGGDDGKGV